MTLTLHSESPYQFPTVSVRWVCRIDLSCPTYWFVLLALVLRGDKEPVAFTHLHHGRHEVGPGVELPQGLGRVLVTVLPTETHQ